MIGTGAEAVFGSVAETTCFLSYFRDLPDARQAGKVVYPLNEVLLMALLCVLAGAESFTDIERFGEKKLALLRRFPPFVDGTPPHDTLGDIFATLDADAFQRRFVDWVAALTKTPVEVIAIDGKTLRRTGGKASSRAPIHMVSAFAARQRLVLAQTMVEAKSNEIVAIPALLDMMAIEGAVVTIVLRQAQDEGDGLSARHRDEDHREKSRLHSRAQGQLRKPARGCRSLRERAENQRVRRHDDHHAPNPRCRSWPHRDAKIHRHS